MTTKEYFPGIGKIPFEGKESKNPMAFHYYNAEKVIRGKKMKDWLRFSMAWWHTLCAEGGDQFGGGTKRFPWNVASSPIQRAKDKMDAGFEFMQKCGIGYYCFHDIDLVEEVIERQLRKYKNKLVAKNQEGNNFSKTLFETEESIEDGEVKKYGTKEDVFPTLFQQEKCQKCMTEGGKC